MRKTHTTTLRYAWLFSPLLALSASAQATDQTAPPDENSDVVVLSPFEVTTEEQAGYTATTSMAGTRLNSELRDIGSAISVITKDFLRDTGAVDNQTLLQYTTGTEVGNIYGNFSNASAGPTQNETGRFASPNTNTRVRGLTSADNTRDFFRSNIPWDGYNVERIDMQRGANAILFGLGSPAGIINATTTSASFEDSGEVEMRFGRWGSTRVSVNINEELIDNTLAIRIAGLRDDESFQQDPAFDRDERIFAAMRFEPKLFRNGYTSLKANFEHGEIRSNRPRTYTPVDAITPWFSELDRQTYSQAQLEDNEAPFDPNTGQRRPNWSSGAVNPYYEPWIGNFAQLYGGPLVVFPDHTSSQQSMMYLSEFRNVHGIGPNGAVDGGVGGYGYARNGGVALYSEYARNAKLDLWNFGVYKNRHLTDPSIFDFYNNLIDGPNKSEFQDFDAFNVSLAQTFMDNLFGAEIAYDQQSYTSGQLSFLSDQRAAINIDLNRTLLDGSPNPNVGRPFISEAPEFGNNRTDIDSDTLRVTAFVDYNFERRHGHNLLTRILGRHVLTGLYSEESEEQDYRAFLRYNTTDGDYMNYIGAQNLSFKDNIRMPNPVVYLGPSLSSRNTAAGANIPRVEAMMIPQTGLLYSFDSHWNAPNINPAAPWTNPNTGAASTQSENPANYVGWTTRTVDIVHASDSQAAQNALTTTARLTRREIDSRALVWQAHFWDNLLVGTYGWREDTAKSWSHTAPRVRDRSVLDSSYRLPAQANNVLKDETTSYSIVAHLSQLLGDRAPFNFSVYHSNSENWRPEASRVDVYGTPLPAPTGETKETGIMLSTRDDRYSVRINKYESSVTYQSSNAVSGDWFIGGLQAWGANWANIFQHNLGGYTMDTANQGDPGRHNYAPAREGEDAAAREAAAVAAWRQLQAKIPAGFWTAWGLGDISQVKNFSQSNPAGFTTTEDTVSEGYEVEFTAQPTRNWRITFNAAKQEAVRRNVGGVTLNEYVNMVEDALYNTAAGDLRIWWGSAGSTTTLEQWNNNFGSNYALVKLQEGNAVPELREWRFNLVTNYDFDEGFLKGFNVGVGYRWEDEVVIGYRPITDPNNPARITFDLENPYMGPTESHVDFWVGYGRKLTDRIDWRIQLNVRDAFAGDDLIPVSTQPNGEIAAWRIAPPMVWSITNTFRF